MIKFKNLLFGSFLGLMAFSFWGENEPNVREDPRLFSVAWFAFSAEKEACYLQTYQLAQWKLESLAKEKRQKHLALITDLDETVLDNSAWSAKVLLEGKDYPDHWSDWEKAGKAPPFPGAVEFFQKAKSLGIEIFYVSNRLQENLGATLLNLRNLGLPQADSAHVLLKTQTSNKIERRKQVLDKYQVVMLLGDNLADFEGIWEEKLSPSGRLGAVLERKKEWGNRFIIFPNPVYGTWKDAQLGYKRGLSLTQADSSWRWAFKSYLEKVGF
jgi:5'-nucleotidase (lipoprotein e(P4) family)